jgi:hypothetical protein
MVADLEGVSCQRFSHIGAPRLGQHLGEAKRITDVAGFEIGVLLSRVERRPTRDHDKPQHYSVQHVDNRDQETGDVVMRDEPLVWNDAPKNRVRRDGDAGRNDHEQEERQERRGGRKQMHKHVT